METQGIPTIHVQAMDRVPVAPARPLLFTIIEDQVILRSTRGVYKQAKLATRGEFLYAATAGGFVMLYANGTTSSPTLRWEEIEGIENYRSGRLGRLVTLEALS